MNEQTIAIIPLDPEGHHKDTKVDALSPGRAPVAAELVRAKLIDAQIPGFQAEFDPAEAEAAGAFPEDALTEADALASMHDALHFVALSSPGKL